MRRREAIQLTAAGLGALWNGCSRTPVKPRSLRVASGPYLSNAGFFVAQESGFFREAGLEIETFPSTNSPEGIALLAGGALDVGLYTIGPALINVVAAGKRVRIVAPGT